MIRKQASRSCIQADRQTSYMTELSLATWERYILFVLENYNIGTRAYVAVLDMPAIVPFHNLRQKV